MSVGFVVDILIAKSTVCGVPKISNGKFGNPMYATDGHTDIRSL